MEERVDGIAGDGVAEVAVRGERVQERPRRGPGALVRIGAHKDIRRPLAKIGGQDALFPEVRADSAPHGRDELPPARGEVAALDWPDRPDALAPFLQRFVLLGGRAHAVARQHHDLDELPVVGGGSRGRPRGHEQRDEGEQGQQQGRVGESAHGILRQSVLRAFSPSVPQRRPCPARGRWRLWHRPRAGCAPRWCRSARPPQARAPPPWAPWRARSCAR